MRKKIVFIICTLAITILAGCRSQNQSVTLEQFEQTYYGMSLSDVTGILGSEGKQIYAVITEVGFTQTLYIWQGNGENSAVTMGFTNDHLMTRIQIGLE